MPVIPPFNADAAQVPFLRWAQEKILELEQENARRAQNENNTNRGQSGTIDALQVQVQDLNSAQVELAGAYQAAATAEDLARVASNARLSPAVDNASTSGFTVTTGGITVISRSISVPTDFTRAVVMSTGTVGTLVSGSDNIYGTITINGNGGPQAAVTTSSTAPYGVVSPSHAVNLSSLSGSFNISLQARVDNSAINFNTNATLTTIIIFLP